MARKPKEIRELRIVLDTNALFTSLGDELVNHETAQLIEANNNHPDLKVSWYMPEIVFEERLFQMRRQTVGLISNLTKVEKLLGHNLGLTKDFLDTKVLDVAKKHANDLGITIIKLDVTEVDWESVSHASVRREPPFEKGDKEKGFRDALIGHTFLQILKASPRSSTKCRLALISGDQLLSEFVRSHIDGFANVQVFDGLEELKGLINTLSSQVEESFVDELQKKARLLFFVDANATDTLYYKEKISDRIQADFSSELKALPEGATSRLLGQTLISQPRFVRKEKQRVHWVSRITFNSKAMQWVSPPAQSGGLGALAIPNANSLGTLLTGPSGGLGSIPTSETVGLGKTLFDVHWSTTVNNKKQLSHPSIDSVEFVETTWQQP
jgi:predicted nucleic acid-binding protein